VPLFLTEDFNAFLGILLVDVRGYCFSQYRVFQQGHHTITWLTAFCTGLAATLKAGDSLIVLAPSPLANYWTEKLDKLLTKGNRCAFNNILNKKLTNSGKTGAEY